MADPVLVWLPDVLRDAKVDVHVMPGSDTHGKKNITIKGIVWHHTATGPNWKDERVASLLWHGRNDLPGPLSQVGIERDGTWVIVSMNRANHNGYGEWGNDSLGLEFYNKGDGIDPWPEAQLTSGYVGIAACLKHLGFGVEKLKGHKETDPTRKVDPRPLDMDVQRFNIDLLLHPPFPPTPTPSEEDDQMKDRVYIAPDGRLVLLRGERLVVLGSSEASYKFAPADDRIDCREDQATWDNAIAAFGQPIEA